MPRLDASYRINDAEVIAESVGGELLIINLSNGTYYSSEGTGDQIWALLVANSSLTDVVAWLSARYGADRTEIQEAVEAFADELEREGLIVRHPHRLQAPTAPAAANGDRFRTPVLHKYTDFQGLLWLDPIHEVDRSAGWPQPKPSA
jgi:hypothetical protein